MTVTAPMQQHDVQHTQLNDLMVPRTAFTGLTASQLEAAAGAAESDNNVAWVADVAASSSGESVRWSVAFTRHSNDWCVGTMTRVCTVQVWQCWGSRACYRGCGSGVTTYSQVTFTVWCAGHPSRTCARSLHESCSAHAGRDLACCIAAKAKRAAVHLLAATSLEQPHTPNSSGTSSRGQRGGKPRRSPQASLKRRGRRPADKSAFQRDIEVRFTAGSLLDWSSVPDHGLLRTSSTVHLSIEYKVHS